MLWPGEVERAVALLLGTGRTANDRVHAALAPAIDRFGEQTSDEQDPRSSNRIQATLRSHQDSGEAFKPLETTSLKSIAAFLHSRYGETLTQRRATCGLKYTT